MASVLAILSKAFFARELQVDGRVARPGDVIVLDRYLSEHKGLTPLAAGGSLFLVTVRPKEQLLLVAELEQPVFREDHWYSATPNSRPVTDVTNLRDRLRFARGEGIAPARALRALRGGGAIQAKPGRLAMSLQTPRVLTDGDVVALRAALGGATAPPASPEAKEPGDRRSRARGATAKERQTPERFAGEHDLAVGRRLSQALDALDEDPEQAFSLMRQCWEETRWRRLAGLIEAIGRRHGAAGELPVALAGTKKRVSQVDWLTAEQRASPLQRGALLSTLTSGTIGEVGERIERMERWEPDPRAAAALIEVVAQVPWVSSGSRTTWTKVYRALRALADPRLLDVADSFDSSVLPTGWQGAREFFDDKLAALAAKVREALPSRSPSEAEDQLLGRLEQRLGGTGGAAPRRSDAKLEEALLHQVLDSPDDDESTAVLADLLLERGDVRGELIQLQLIERRGKLSREQRARKDQIIKQSADQLLGPLAPLVLKRGLTFERGFVNACVLKGKLDARDVEAAMGHPLLGALREIEGPLSFVLQPALRNLRLIAVADREDLSQLGALQRELPIEALACFIQSNTDAELIGQLANVPRLETFYAICPSLSSTRALMRTPLGRRLRRLCVDSRPMWTHESVSVEQFPLLYDIATDTGLEQIELRWDHYYTGSFLGRPPWGQGVVARRQGRSWSEERNRRP